MKIVILKLFDILFLDCDKKTPPPIPPTMQAKFASLIEAYGLEFREIFPLVNEGSHVSV